MKKVFIIASLVLMSSLIYSQSDTAKFSVDITNNFLFRGMCLTNKASVQPVISLSRTTKSKVTFEVGTFGSFAYDGSYSEVDLYGKVAGKHVAFVVTDYMLNLDDPFNYTDSTNNIVELSLFYTFNFPLTFSVNTNVWGYDKIDNEQLYSTYVEASYMFDHVALFAGVSPYKSIYSDNFGLVNCGVTLFKQNCKIPIRTSLIVNPDKKVIYANVAFTF
jgi:hypothetical protein